ncbi:ABC transporter permease, partial [Rhodospirillum rubrum]
RQARWGALARGGVALLGNRLVCGGLAVVIALGVVAVFAPALAPYDPLVQDLSQRLRPPSAAHWLGTDHLGRDIFSRVLCGTPITLSIVTIAALTVLPVSLIIGMVAGFFGGIVDAVLMRTTDVFLSFPLLVLALALAAALGPGLVNAVIAIALTAWPPLARLVRAETRRLKQADFVAATRLQGASALRLLSFDILPLVLPAALTRLSLDLAGMILIAASLGFLGLGAQPPSPEWGAMVAAGRTFLMDQWWVATLPGVAIFIVSFAFNLLGDGVSEVLDPKE